MLAHYIGIAVLVLKVDILTLLLLLNGVGELAKEISGVKLFATDVDGDVFFHNVLLF